MTSKVAALWLRRTVGALAVAYPVALLAAVATLLWIGERWWISAVALYLPRLGFAAPLPVICLACLVLRMRRLATLQLASALIVTFPLMGLSVPLSARAHRERPRLRVLSFNVNSAHGGVPAVMGEIDHFAPDVLTLQECGDDDPLSGALRARYPTVEVSGQFIFATRYAVTAATEPEKLAYGGRSRSARFNRHALETPLGRLVVYNVHPLSPREALYGLRGQTGLLHEIRSGSLFAGPAAQRVADNVGLRTLQVQTFADAARRETDPVIIAGDTNLPGLSALLTTELSSFVDGFSEAGWGLGYTFPTDRWRPWMRIDRIMASRPLHFVGFEVGRTRASDHHCVVADIEIAR